MAEKTLTESQQYVKDSQSEWNKKKVNRSLDNGVMDHTAYCTSKQYASLDKSFSARWEQLKNKTFKKVNNILK